MSEYRLPDSCPLSKNIVLCKIYRKATSIKVLEQRAAMEESQPPSPPNSINSQHIDLLTPSSPTRLSHVSSRTNDNEASKEPSLKLPVGSKELLKLRLPKCEMGWCQDSQSRSPWLQDLIFTPSPCANILSFLD
ncbi:hypothetical protein L1987_06327 [Smallanthus sonchifolius]|uniref:Uncharacterized protein n=1 Tax=Smallanthus sonchifolius TaxID=185202 RepID=A0ACB9JY24_9ASTR|nr:hypothetical protein L1987_06327 [Smallanthus sonchifolius]